MIASRATATPCLGVSRLCKHYGAVAALDRVSFSVRPSEVLGLIGPNGAGKTTLLECLAGVQPADSGQLLTATGDRLAPAERSRLLFFVPDGIRPWPDQRVSWALDFVLGLFGGPSAMHAEVVGSLQLDELMGSRIRVLSKGQLKRVLLAIGLLTPQPLLLIDEPFDGLDLPQTRALGGTLRAHASRGRTLLVSIHQISDAGRLCDRFVLLSGGRVVGEGGLEELAARAAVPSAAGLEEVFLALV